MICWARKRKIDKKKQFQWLAIMGVNGIVSFLGREETE